MITLLLLSRSYLPCMGDLIRPVLFTSSFKKTPGDPVLSGETV